MARPFSFQRYGRTVRLTGDLDISTASELEAHLDGITDTSGDIVIDASELTFIDSSGIRVVFGLARRLEGRGRVAIVNATDQVLRVLDLVNAASLLDVLVERR